MWGYMRHDGAYEELLCNAQARISCGVKCLLCRSLSGARATFDQALVRMRPQDGRAVSLSQKCRRVVVDEMMRIQLTSLIRCVTPTVASLGGWHCAQPPIMDRTRYCHGIEGSPAQFLR